MTAEQKVAKAAAKSAAARQELDAAIRAARAEGVPLRALATAANLSPEWVRKISRIVV